MIRKTHVHIPDSTTTSYSFKMKQDKFWDWIEGMPVTDEMWRVESTGAMVLVVDEETLVEILSDDMNKAHEDFDTYALQDRETGEWDIIDLPLYLCGTYRIQGVYNEKQELVDGDRSYFFSQEF